MFYVYWLSSSDHDSVVLGVLTLWAHILTTKTILDD